MRRGGRGGGKGRRRRVGERRSPAPSAPAASAAAPTFDVFVRELPSAAGEEDLFDAFSAFGDVAGTAVIRDKVSGASRRYGFVHFSREGGRARCIQARAVLVLGHAVKVGAAESKSTVYVGGLAPDTAYGGDQDGGSLRRDLEALGGPMERLVVRQGFAFATYVSFAAAAAAIKALDGAVVGGAEVFAQLARSRTKDPAAAAAPPVAPPQPAPGQAGGGAPGAGAPGPPATTAPGVSGRPRLVASETGPQMLAAPGVSVYVRNLPPAATEASLRDHFSAGGRVVRAVVAMNVVTGRPRGFGFVEMASEDECRAAVRTLNGRPFLGSPLQVEVSRRRGQRRAEQAAAAAAATAAAAADLAVAPESPQVSSLPSSADDATASGWDQPGAGSAPPQSPVGGRPRWVRVDVPEDAAGAISFPGSAPGMAGLPESVSPPRPPPSGSPRRQSGRTPKRERVRALPRRRRAFSHGGTQHQHQHHHQQQHHQQHQQYPLHPQPRGVGGLLSPHMQPPPHAPGGERVLPQHVPGPSFTPPPQLQHQWVAAAAGHPLPPAAAAAEDQAQQLQFQYSSMVTAFAARAEAEAHAAQQYRMAAFYMQSGTPPPPPAAAPLPPSLPILQQQQQQQQLYQLRQDLEAGDMLHVGVDGYGPDGGPSSGSGDEEEADDAVARAPPARRPLRITRKGSLSSLSDGPTVSDDWCKVFVGNLTETARSDGGGGSSGGGCGGEAAALDDEGLRAGLQALLPSEPVRSVSRTGADSAFLTFDTRAVAERAAALLNGAQFGGHALRAECTLPRPRPLSAAPAPTAAGAAASAAAAADAAAAEYRAMATAAAMAAEAVRTPRVQHQFSFAMPQPHAAGPLAPAPAPPRSASPALLRFQSPPAMPGTLYVQGVPPGMAEQHVAALFTPFGAVSRVTLPRQPHGSPRGYAFVEFMGGGGGFVGGGGGDPCEAAVQALNGSVWGGHQLSVAYARHGPGSRPSSAGSHYSAGPGRSPRRRGSLSRQGSNSSLPGIPARGRSRASVGRPRSESVDCYSIRSDEYEEEEDDGFLESPSSGGGREPGSSGGGGKEDERSISIASEDGNEE